MCAGRKANSLAAVVLLASITSRRLIENSQPLERLVANRALTNDYSVPENAAARGEKRLFSAAIDPVADIVHAQ